MKRLLAFLVAALAVPAAASAQSKVIDGFERPEYASEADFKTAVARRVAKGETTGFVVRPEHGCASVTDASGLATTLYKMVGVEVTTPSYAGGRTGTFYDALVPVSPANCATAKYLWLDVAVPASAQAGALSLSIDGARITLDVQNVGLPAEPRLPIRMAFSNSMMWRGWYGKWAPVEARGREFLDLMVKHQLAPYESEVSNPPVVDGRLDVDNGKAGNISFRQHVLDFSPGLVWFPNGLEAAVQKTLADIGATGRAWFYSKDEPGESELPALRTMLTKQKADAPGVKRMVTLVHRADFDGLIDIWTPVAEQFCVEGRPCEADYRGKGDLWLYVSCMSHGCDVDRAGNANAPKVPGNATGAPDLVLDRPAVEAFGYVTLALKYPSVKALLYYNTVEQWKLYPGIDMWTDPFNFGGNMDGTLFWAGRPGIEGLTTYEPLVSVRMKLLRQASYFFDLMAMARDKNAAWVTGQVDALMTATTKWDRTLSKFASVRDQAFATLR